jgi:hypothetical protein
MNRHERRRQEREQEKQARKCIAPMQKPVMIPEHEVKDFVKKHLKPTIDQTMLITFEVVMRILALSINSQEGWGKKRIQKLIDRIMLQFDCITAGTLTGADIAEFCREKDINVEVSYAGNQD